MNHIGFGQSSFALKAIGFTNKANPDDAILALFADGKQGVWFDPSDKSTLFQDAAGTVPVTKDGDPVGLILDKSQGLLLGDNTITVPPTVGTLSAYSIDSLITDGLNITSATQTAGIGGLTFELSNPIATGEYVLVTFEVTSLTGTIYSRLVKDNTGAGGGGSESSLVPKLKLGFNSAIFNITSLPATHLQLQANGAASFSANNFKVQTIKGNHASQPLAASRPTYKAVSDKAWLYNDKVDDKLLVKLPAITATVVKATDEGVSINYPVNITARDYAITSTSALGRDYSYLIINKELSVSEATQVTSYFNAKRGV